MADKNNQGNSSTTKIVKNQNCKEDCGALNAQIAGVPEYMYFDTAQELLEKRTKSKQKQTESGTNFKIPGDNQFTLLYTERDKRTACFENFSSQVHGQYPRYRLVL